MEPTHTPFDNDIYIPQTLGHVQVESIIPALLGPLVNAAAGTTAFMDMFMRYLLDVYSVALLHRSTQSS